VNIPKLITLRRSERKDLLFAVTDKIEFTKAVSE